MLSRFRSMSRDVRAKAYLHANQRRQLTDLQQFTWD